MDNADIRGPVMKPPTEQRAPRVGDLVEVDRRLTRGDGGPGTVVAVCNQTAVYKIKYVLGGQEHLPRAALSLHSGAGGGSVPATTPRTQMRGQRGRTCPTGPAVTARAPGPSMIARTPSAAGSRPRSMSKGIRPAAVAITNTPQPRAAPEAPPAALPAGDEQCWALFAARKRRFGVPATPSYDEFNNLPPGPEHKGHAKRFHAFKWATIQRKPDATERMEQRVYQNSASRRQQQAGYMRASRAPAKRPAPSNAVNHKPVATEQQPQREFSNSERRRAQQAGYMKARRAGVDKPTTSKPDAHPGSTAATSLAPVDEGGGLSFLPTFSYCTLGTGRDHIHCR